MTLLLIILFILIYWYSHTSFNKYHFSNTYYDQFLIKNTKLNDQPYLSFLESLKKNHHTQKINKKCIEDSIKICEFSNPYSYISNSKYFPAPWLIKSYKNIEYPKSININCFNTISNCCKNHKS